MESLIGLFGRGDWLLIILASLLFVRLFRLFNSYVYKKMSRKKFTIKRNVNSDYNKLTLLFFKHENTKRLIFFVASKIGMVNDNSLRKNLNIASYVITGVLSSLVVIFLYFIISGMVWYMVLLYTLVIIVFTLVIISIVASYLKLGFTKEIPTTFKLLSSRLSVDNNIVRVINRCIPDSKNAMKRELRKIHNVLLKNNSVEVTNTFNVLKKTYNSEHFTLLLNFIEQYHLRGGTDSIKIQMERATEDILVEIEDHKDIISITRGFMIMSMIAIPFMLNFIESFSIKAMGTDMGDFYASTQGVTIKIVAFVALVIYVFTLYFIEKTEV